MPKITTTSLNETKALAKEIAGRLEPLVGDATVLALFGDLGAGKTSFTQGLAEALGVTETISSPTFVIEKIYDLQNQSFQKLIHIDAYRLDEAEDLLKLGFTDQLSETDNLIVLEWPEKVFDALPTNIKKINFKFINEETREIEYEI
ncbi:MAG: tRNA threonylcarbamoyladenosine biosynthesis protein TsaE [Patescibacteria group bacterium]|nr:tRNA threonylcarbamoyladenosine biosynthesis protein TsaE [Patescibacteria group bacterium]